MRATDNTLLRSVALPHAPSNVLLRPRTESAQIKAKDALQRRTQELAQSLAMMRATLEASTDGILMTDCSGKVTGYNEKFVRLWRLPDEVMQARSHDRILAWNAHQFDDPQAFVARARQIYADSAPESYDLLELADGRVFERFSRTQLIDHRNVGRVWSVRDVTRRRQDENQLRRSAQTARFLAEASAAMAGVTDVQSTLQRIASLAVPAFADWCAMDMPDGDGGGNGDGGSLRRLAVAHVDAIPPLVARQLFCCWDQPAAAARHGIMRVLRTGAPEWAAKISESLLADLTQGGENLRQSRQLGLRSYICVPLRSGTRTHGVLTFATAQSGRTYDAAQVIAAGDLAHRAAVSIENAELLAELQDSDRRKDEFLAMLAHELRNPLAPIRNGVQIYRAKGPDDPELSRATEVIDRQVRQMTRLVDDLLDVSRITRGRIELRRERVALAAIVDSAVEASQPLIQKRRHQLTVRIPAAPIWLYADATRMAQVLANLIHNAAKYMDQAGRIQLSAERQGEQAVVRIKDTGVGIPAAMLPRIFDMFTQLDSSRDRSEGGLGIGLTLVQSLVELHGGTVEAHSEGQGKGSEFVVRVPAPADLQTAASPAAAHEGAPEAAGAGRRILVVDDNRDAAETLVLLLQMMGNQVQEAHDGLEAVAAAASFRPEIILLDIGLPGLNGYQAARRIREQDGGSGIVLVALTGWGQDEDRRRSKEAGFDHHLTKPVDLADLQALLAGHRPAASS
jgi:signal transduction histidine kinase/ActR/RegA family two-component response regulator